MEAIAMTPMIATREDLDALAGTPAYDNFLAALAGTLYRVERNGEGWTVIEDDSTIARYGFTRADFPDAQPPALPVITSQDINQQIDAQIRALEGAAPTDRAVREYMLWGMIDRFRQTPRGAAITGTDSEVQVQIAAILINEADPDYAPGFARAWDLDTKIRILRRQRV